MSSNPCSVCGNTDLNLVDGYYYCVECGTQDVNVRETVIEYASLADGTLAVTGVKKVTTVVKDGIQMSGEWHKWHAYNFILSGWTDELIGLGAKQSVKMKVLWIWTRYIKKYQVKENLSLSSIHDENNDDSTKKGKQIDESSDENELEENKKGKKKEELVKDIKNVSKALLLAIIYVALNLDGSDIQPSHLLRFIREGRLSYISCMKFVPKELDVKAIPQWNSFSCYAVCSTKTILAFSMTLFKTLDLDLPIVPNLRNIVDNFVTELCLPNDFKNIVFSLMQTFKCDYLNIDEDSKRDSMHMVDYECNMMSFILITLKMCFGLDDKYEYEMSDVVEKINYAESRAKSHKLGLFSDHTDRLFSFREWLNFLQFRKSLLSKQYLPMAQKYNLEVDDYVFMEHLEPRNQRPATLGDEVTLDILNKIPLNEDGRYIPIAEFTPSLTPMTTYTEVILQYTQDPDLRLLLSEDFSQYSVKYTYDTLTIGKEYADVFKGVKRENKMINRVLKNSTLHHGYNTKPIEMVYVKNCDNKNWLITNPPTAKHVTIVKETNNDRDSDHGYDSNAELVDGSEKPVTEEIDTEKERKLESIDEENEENNIFDDLFIDAIDDEDESKETEDSKNPTLVELEISNAPYSDHEDDKTILQDSKENITDNASEMHSTDNTTENRYNPETFDRQGTIKELVLAACKKYKIPVPAEYRIKEPRKRRSVANHDMAGQSEAKKQKKETNTKKGDSKAAVDKLLSAYYNHMQNDVLNQVSNQVRNAVDAFENLEINLEQNNHIEINEDNMEQSNVNDECRSENSNVAHIDNADNVERSLGEGSDHESVTELIPKGDPRFDETKYDVKQLFLKFKDEFDVNEMFDIEDDPELENLFNEKEVSENTNSNDCEELESDFTSEDDLPISKLKPCFNEKRPIEQLQLVLDKSKKKSHEYWLRCYPPSLYSKKSCKNVFDLELKKLFPASFTLLILECAELLECSAFMIYKNMQTLEQILFK